MQGPLLSLEARACQPELSVAEMGWLCTEHALSGRYSHCTLHPGGPLSVLSALLRQERISAWTLRGCLYLETVRLAKMET